MLSQPTMALVYRRPARTDGTVVIDIRNKSFGISSSLRHICAACIQRIFLSSIQLEKNCGNLFMVIGVIIGGFIAHIFEEPWSHEDQSPWRLSWVPYGIISHSSAHTGDHIQLVILFTMKGFSWWSLEDFVGFVSDMPRLYERHSIMGLSPMVVKAIPDRNYMFLYGRRLHHG